MTIDVNIVKYIHSFIHSQEHDRAAVIRVSDVNALQCCLFRLLQMVKMMVTVVVIYALCWLPLHSVTLAGDTNPAVWTYRHIQVVWIAAHWLAMSNCCCNPFVYFWMSSNFRSAFRRLAGMVLCRRRDDGPTTAAHLSPMGRGNVVDRRAVQFADAGDHALVPISPNLRSLRP